MKIIDKNDLNYYELEVTKDGIKTRYIPLGSYNFIQSGFEFLPENHNDKKSFIKMLTVDLNFPRVGVALSCQYHIFIDEIMDSEEDSLFIELMSNTIFKNFCEKYFFIGGEFNPDIFIDNCKEFPEYSEIIHFKEIDSDKIMVTESGYIFELISTDDNKIVEDTLEDLLIKKDCLKTFENDYRKVITLFDVNSYK